MTLIDFLEENRGLVVLLFCLPASFLFNLYLELRRKFHLIFSSPSYHDREVQKIQKCVQKWRKLPKNERRPMCTARPNWQSLSTTFFQKKQCHQVPVNLFSILHLDEEKLTVRVEPGVTVRDITKFLIPKGYTLSVTLEIADATLGGLALASGMTTHSHKVGLLHETVVDYEVVLADGSVVTASREENVDLYDTLPWSHGTLGFLVALTLRIEPIKPYIKLTYTPIRGQKAYCDHVRKISGDHGDDDALIPDYVEATIYSKDEAVVMQGDYADYDPQLPINRISAWYKPWFYKHAQSALQTGEMTELIPLRDYLLRHDRAIFWVVESMLPFGNHPLFRLLFGWLLPPKPAFLKYTTTPGVRAYTFARQVFQDIVLPIRDLERQIDISEKLFDLYPLLVYPCKIYDRGAHRGQLPHPAHAQLVPNRDYAIYNDLGIYGVPGYVQRKEKYNAVRSMREMEQFTRDAKGFPFLYADIFMTRAEFERTFDLTLYEHVRKTYGAAEAFPHLFDKVKPEIDVMKIGEQYEIQ